MSGEPDNASLTGSDRGAGDEASGRRVMIACDLALLLFQAAVFWFVLRCAWDNYCESMGLHKKTLLHFLRCLPPVKTCFLASNFIILASTAIFIIRLSLPPPSDNFTCSLALRITGPTCYITEMTSIYVYLWARQYYLHSALILKRVMPKWLPILSKVSLALTVGAYTMQLFAFWTPFAGVKSVFRNGQCYHMDQAVAMLPYIILVVTVILQGTYVVLFYAIVTALNKANRRVSRSRKARSSSLSWIAPRCLKQAVACIMSNCTSMVVINAIGSHIPEIYVHAAPQLDTNINLICMLLCFNTSSELAEKVLAMCKCGKGKRLRQNYLTVT